MANRKTQYSNRLMLLIVLLCSASLSVANPNAAAATTNSNSNSQSTNAAAVTFSHTDATPNYCPEAKDLIRDGLTWGAPNGWVSYDKSFIQSIKQFTGAHWIGINIGKIVCSYEGDEKLTFPLLLENEQYVAAPSGASWGVHVDGITNCLSNNIIDCPFRFLTLDTGPTDLESLINLKQKRPGDNDI